MIGFKKMIANYHTHTYHCHHADGVPKDYAEAAVKNGLKILGFSDHVPCPFPEGYHSGFRIRLEKTEQYVSEIEDLKAEFKGKLEIYTGYEAEYYPQLFDGMIKNIENYGYDYLILGQHFTANEYDGVHSFAPCDEDIFNQYINQVISAMKTGAYSYVAHPDLINYSENPKIYRKGVERLCEASNIYDVPLEFNLLGFREGRHYPYSSFWKVVAAMGCKTIIGCDAHTAPHTGEPEIYNNALTALEQYGIKPLEKLTFKKLK